MNEQYITQFTAHYVNDKGESFSQIVAGSNQLEALENARANLPQGCESLVGVRIEGKTVANLDWIAGMQQFEREWRNEV